MGNGITSEIYSHLASFSRAFGLTHNTTLYLGLIARLTASCNLSLLYFVSMVCILIMTSVSYLQQSRAALHLRGEKVTDQVQSFSSWYVFLLPIIQDIQ
jgi:hypothetical protein